MAQLRQDYAEFMTRGAAVLVVWPDKPADVRDFYVKQDLPFPGLLDPEHKVADLYGQQVKLLKFGRMPAIMVIDRAGNIRYTHYADSMSDIPANQEVLRILDQINQEG
jgi:peroxiredoxin Q/BCP